MNWRPMSWLQLSLLRLLVDLLHRHLEVPPGPAGHMGERRLLVADALPVRQWGRSSSLGVPLADLEDPSSCVLLELAHDACPLEALQDCRRAIN